MIIKYKASQTAAKFHSSGKVVRGIMGPVGCVSGDTQFLTQNGWKRIDEYKQGDLVAQWHKETGSIEFVYPKKYIAEPCDFLYELQYGSKKQVLSLNHRIPLLNFNKNFVVKTAEDVINHPSKHTVINKFKNNATKLGLSEDEIRLRVMIAADGHYPKIGKQCIVCVRKDRKKIRIQEILTSLGINYFVAESKKRNGEIRFTFDRPNFNKELNLSANWYSASSYELSVLLEECLFWDGLNNHKEKRYYTCKKDEAEVIQFAAHASGHTATIRKYISKNANHNICYTVQWANSDSNKNNVMIRCDNFEVEKKCYDKQYCFELASTFWVARYDENIFITGNSGKSVACINELHRLAVLQEPNSNGERLTRWALIRNTTPELRTTTLKTFKQWIPENLCPIVMHPMITGTLKYALPDGTKVNAEFIFISLDREEDTKKLLSLELTGCFINEARQLPYAVVKACRERIGRYPSQVDGYGKNACTRKALIMDTNPPDEQHWWYKLAELGGISDEVTQRERKETEEIFDFFKSPSPLVKRGNNYYPSSKAENVDHLPGGYKYYLDMIAGNTQDHINVMVMGNYGAIKSGKPVYPEYNDLLHCSEGLEVYDGYPIGVGIDFGHNPSFVFGQLTAMGQLRVFAELTTDKMDVRQFARDVVIPWVKRNLDGLSISFAYADPAGNTAGEGDGKSAIGILNDEYLDHNGSIMDALNLGFDVEPAPTNDTTKRLDAVRVFLMKLVGDGQPAILVDKNCKVLRSGFNGAYCYKTVHSGNGLYKAKPDKNAYSHCHDALQYLCLGFVNGAHEQIIDYNDRNTRQNVGPMGY